MLEKITRRVSYRSVPQRQRSCLTTGNKNKFILCYDDHHTVAGLLLGTVLPPWSLTLGLAFWPQTSSFSRRRRLVGLMAPVGLLGIDPHNFMASTHKRSAGLDLRLNPPRSKRFHSQLRKVFRQNSSISAGHVLELVVIVLPILPKGRVTR